MYKLVTISCYFGKWPEHFPEFLRSVALNPTVDFVFVTDCDIDELPANARLHKCSIDELRDRFQNMFDFPIILDRPYKLCDYKPIWGLAFPEYIKDYDFWGYCDIDLIFGNIRTFLTDDVLSRHDKIYKLGHLTYYRNTEENNQRYKLDGGVHYRDAFTTKEITAFDEIAGMQNIYDKHGFSTYKSRDYADITYMKVHLTWSYFQIPEELVAVNNYDKQVFYWENGHVYRAYFHNDRINVQEFIYIHFPKRKMPRNDLPHNSACFFITSKGFFLKDGPVNTEDFDQYNSREPIAQFARSLKCWYNGKKTWCKYYWGIITRKFYRLIRVR
jgi:hypothetical protein